jgi:hypothetical protein
VDGERRPGIAAVEHSVLQAAERLLLAAYAEHIEHELQQVQSLLCSVALDAAALAAQVQRALMEVEDDAWQEGVVGDEEEIGFFVVQLEEVVLIGD